MEFQYHIDEVRLSIASEELFKKIHRRPEQNGISDIEFDTGFFGNTERYKYRVYENARRILAADSWTEEMIGQHTITDRILDALKAGNNLVHFMTNDFSDKAERDINFAERILYNLFKSQTDSEEQAAFEAFVKYFGRNYSRTAYLFFLKNREKYLPIKPEFFKKRFSDLNIRTDCTSGCTWEHYLEFIQIIRDIQGRIESQFNHDVTLLDAHSFVWCMYLLEDALENIDNDFVDYSDGQIKVTEEEWEELLCDEDIFTQEFLELLGRIYISENHAATASDLARADGKHSFAYNSSVAAMGRNVSKRLGLPELIRENGQYRWWPVLFYGRKLISGLFEWQMRPELIAAYSKVCKAEIETVIEQRDEREAETSDDDVLLIMARSRSNQTVNPTTRMVAVEQKYRDPYISELAKRRANGICLLCGEDAPFKDKKGRPYLESHHINWLSEGGNDSIDNVAALCPNCHRKMHQLKGTDEEIQDRQFLLSCVADYNRREMEDIGTEEL